MGKTIFRQLFDHESSTFTYLVGCTRTQQAALIDPVFERIERDLRLLSELGLSLAYAMDTHIHADHVSALGELRKRTKCQTAICKVARVDCADVELSDGDKIKVGDCAIKVITSPGHTDCSVSYLWENRLFTGDALFIRGCGRTDFQNGDAGTLYDSVTNKLFTLGDGVEVYPGHDYNGFQQSTIGEEKQWNPRLSKTRSEFIELMKNLKLGDPKRMHEAIPKNKGCGEQKAG